MYYKIKEISIQLSKKKIEYNYTKFLQTKKKQKIEISQSRLIKKVCVKREKNKIKTDVHSVCFQIHRAHMENALRR